VVLVDVQVAGHLDVEIEERVSTASVTATSVSVVRRLTLPARMGSRPSAWEARV
jgi:hypothetical protein